MRDSELSEAEWQQQVTDLASQLGWRWAHFRPARTAHGWRTPVSGTIGQGWPDLTLVRERDRRLVFAELKRASGKVDPRQAAVLEVLRTAAEVYVWRPGDLDEVVRVLR